MDATQPKRGPGRPRSFDETTALHAAMRCFWAMGYARASIDTLSREMQMPRASLYATYGDKDGLFLAAIAHYAQTRTGVVIAHLTGQGDAAAEVSAFLGAMIDMVTSDPATPGCLIACVLSEAATAHPSFKAALAARTEALEHRLYASLQAANPLDVQDDLHAKATLLAATARGLAISARAGTDVETLRKTAQMAVRLSCAPAQTH
jgi:AcrR family transcriptional regulator